MNSVQTPLAAVLDRLACPRTGLVVLWMAGLLVFWPLTRGPWLLDDVKLLDGIAAIHAGGAAELFGPDWRAHLLLGADGTGRPLSMLTLSVNALFGDQPGVFKGLNLSLHLIAGSVLLLLVRTLSAPYWPARTAGLLALAVALCWTLHPLQISTVGYVVQRMTILSALLMLLGLWLYARLRSAELFHGRQPSAWAYLLPLVLLPGLAVLAKENGALLLPKLMLLELALFRLRGPPGRRRLLALYFGLVAAACVLAALWLWQDSAGHFAGRAFDQSERLWTQARVVSMYVAQILLPQPGAMPFFYDALPPSTGWLHPPSTLAGLVFLASLIGLGFVLLRSRPLAGFGMVFFFVGHSMESTFLPLELAFEHRNYLPMFGLLLAVGDLVLAAGPALARLRPALALGAVLLLAALSMQRAQVWSEAERIYLNGLSSPWPSERARAGLADLLFQRGRPDAAHALLAAGQSLGAVLQQAWIDCRLSGAVPAARFAAAHARIVPSPSEYDLNALIRVVNLHLDGYCRVEPGALGALLDALAAQVHAGTRQSALVWLYLGHLRHAEGELDAALAALDAAALAANPVPLLLGAEWLIDAGRLDEARQWYQRARAQPLAGRLNAEALFEQVGARLQALEAAR